MWVCLDMDQHTPGGIDIESVVNKYHTNIRNIYSDEYVAARLLNYFFKPSDEFDIKKIKKFITCAIFDSSINFDDVYKPYGVAHECGRFPLIRRDIFDLIIITQHSQKWTDERTLFVQRYYPQHPIPGRGPSFVSQSSYVSDLNSSQSSDGSQLDLSVISSQSSDDSKLDLSVISSQSSDGSKLDLSVISSQSSDGSHRTKTRGRVSRVSKLKHTMNTSYKRGRRGRTLFWQDVLGMAVADKDNHLVDSLAGVLQNHTSRN